MSEAGKTIGIFTGVLDVYVARYATEDTTAAAPTYDPPKVLGASIEVTITPQYAEHPTVLCGAPSASRLTASRRTLIPCRRK